MPDDQPQLDLSDEDDTSYPETDSQSAIDALVSKFASDLVEDETPAEAPSEPQEAVLAPEAPVVPQTPVAAPVPVSEPVAAPDAARERNLAILADRQRAIRAEQETLAAERAAFQAERQQTEQDLARWRSFQTKLQRNDALGALSDMGVRLDDLNRAVLEGRGVNPTSQLEESINGRLQETERRLEQRLDALQKAEHARLERAFFDETRAEIARTSPVLAAMGETGIQAVYQRFQHHAHQGEQLPSYEDVIRAVEREALDFVRPLLRTETVRGLLPHQPMDASPTLSNQQAAAAPTRTQEPPLPSYLDPHDGNDEYLDALVRKYQPKTR